MDITDKAAIVTGSSSGTGIGSETAKLLAARGCNVVINYATNKAGAEDVAAVCRSNGVDAIAVQADVAKDADCVRLVAAAVDRFGRLDVLVNNAAVTRPIPHHEMDKLDATEFERVFSVNLIGSYQMMRATAAHLKATGDAAIVNISTVGAWSGRGSSMAYSASKGALNTLTISMARVLAPQVRVNAICPGTVFGNSWTRKMLGNEGYEAGLRAAESKYPLRRAIYPKDVAAAVLFLIEGAVAMTGECIRMDCGQHLL
ncbi:MAG: SDR family oxidoreductase [Xanthobacteraceae bacterium]|jgi:3-oxoacyl-[acyl-carrier protein] reductase